MEKQNLYRVRLHGKTTILVKASQEQLEKLWKEDKIIEYDLAKACSIKELEAYLQ